LSGAPGVHVPGPRGPGAQDPRPGGARLHPSASRRVPRAGPRPRDSPGDHGRPRSRYPGEHGALHGGDRTEAPRPSRAVVLDPPALEEPTGVRRRAGGLGVGLALLALGAAEPPGAVWAVGEDPVAEVTEALQALGPP